MTVYLGKIAFSPHFQRGRTYIACCAQRFVKVVFGQLKVSVCTYSHEIVEVRSYGVIIDAAEKRLGFVQILEPFIPVG